MACLMMRSAVSMTARSGMMAGRSTMTATAPSHSLSASCLRPRSYTPRWLTSGTPKKPVKKAPEQTAFQKQLNTFLGPKVMPPRWTMAWYREVTLICTVFAITGTSTMVLVRPAVSKGLGLKGSFKEGPWSFRICSLVVMTPIYATLLVCVGTVFGRHHYFRHFSVKMWSRFGIPPEMIDASYHQTKKTFRKW
mmetsp:Transcript_152/g.373  ORF Transcript_152/g.373 Transcript_152/m.373 type:complete len:193 (-) Transcript_152:359-937(-)|eukprot:CAMPEP_0198109028 /NCGR_PEP_ID=MMETSP1442-20131203/1047_1 /TAXON_ID= /ORGANISM="Craspedostauros australis, Strain CCMP3328" /LENGTH=192 /DNA_ID=CAMNT_0043764499 /DNA_START=169 /DNA_END=747 /DNA_ORIENTATION=+